MAKYTLNLTGVTLNDFTHTVSHIKTPYAEADHENFTLEKDGFKISIQEFFDNYYGLTLYGPTGYNGGTGGRTAQQCLDTLLNTKELNEKYDTDLIV